MFNFPETIETENVSDYSVLKETAKETKENPFLDLPAPLLSQEEEKLYFFAEENQIIKKKVFIPVVHGRNGANDSMLILGANSSAALQTPSDYSTVDQLIFDPNKGGFYKRSLRFGIIDFLTVNI